MGWHGRNRMGNQKNKRIVRNRFTSPRGGRRGCLCKNGTYSNKCCKGKLHQQGIGATIGQSTSTIVNTNNKVYELTSDVNNINEGQSVVISLNTENVIDGTNVPYEITGVDANDIDVSLTGNFTINNDTDTLTITALEDLTTEGAETLTLTLVGLGQEIEVTINDTSLNQLLDEFPGASLGYSTKLIKGGYSGALIRVRKDVSGNPERDVLPDSNGEVSDNSPLVGSGQTLGQFKGNAQLFVVRYYDQEENINATQSIASEQPENNNGDVSYVDDYLEAPDDDSLSFTDGTNNTDFTILTEVIFDGFNPRNRAWFVSKRGTNIVGDSLEWQLTYFDGNFRFQIFDVNGNQEIVTSSFTPYIGQKYILGVTLNGNQLDLFLGGVIVATTTISAGFQFFNGTAPVRLGNETFTSDLNFIGKQNTAIIWKDRGMSASEIADIYNNYF